MPTKACDVTTLKDIAAKLGVGVSTVSYVMRGKGEEHHISKTLVERIRATAELMHYRPNVAAQNMRLGRFGNVALVLGARWGIGHLPADLLTAIGDQVEAHDLRLLINRFEDQQLTDQDFVPRILRELSSDGLLIAYNEQVPTQMIALIKRFQLPAIWIDAGLPQDCVNVDDLGAGRLAAEHLLTLGHRRIAYSHFDWPVAVTRGGHHSVADRRRGCEDTVRAAGLEPLEGALRTDAADRTALIAAARRCLAGPDRPTAVVCYGGDDGEAFFAAAHLLGLRVPQDLSLVVVSDRQRPILDRLWTTVCIPLRELGTQAVTMLSERIAAPQHPLAARSFPHHVMPGTTTAPPTSNPLPSPPSSTTRR